MKFVGNARALVLLSSVRGGGAGLELPLALHSLLRE